MNYRRQVSRALDDEHRAHLEFLGRAEQAFCRAPRSGASRDPELQRLCRALAQHAASEIDRHFVFEERELFPLMEAAGDGDMAALLVEEHEAIRAVARELEPLASAAAGGSLPDADWETLKRTALELVERQVAHIQKETMALLPLLDDLLDEATDRELAFSYAG